MTNVAAERDAFEAWYAQRHPKPTHENSTRAHCAKMDDWEVWQARAGAAPAAAAPRGEYPHEQMDAMALDRYKVVPSNASMLWSHAVVAGDGTQQLYVGREVECQNMARKFAGAFLDGAFAFHSTAAAPTAQAVPALEAPAAPVCERCGLSPAEHNPTHWCDNQSFAAAAPQAPAAPSEPVYQISQPYHTDPKNTWRDASEAAYDVSVPARRRVLFTGPAAPAAPAVDARDTARMDWLEAQVVNVRAPLRYGSRDLFWASPEEVDGGPDGPSDLRARIDSAQAAAKGEHDAAD